MNKKFLLIVVGIILFISGCGNKKITCISNAETDTMTIKQTYILTYSEDVINNIEMIKFYSFEDSNQYESFETVFNYTIDHFSSLENDYIDFSYKKDKSSYTLELKVDIKKATKEELEDLGYNKNLLELKESLEEQGLTCE